MWFTVYLFTVQVCLLMNLKTEQHSSIVSNVIQNVLTFGCAQIFLKIFVILSRMSTIKQAYAIDKCIFFSAQWVTQKCNTLWLSILPVTQNKDYGRLSWLQKTSIPGISWSNKHKLTEMNDIVLIPQNALRACPSFMYSRILGEPKWQTLQSKNTF